MRRNFGWMAISSALSLAALGLGACAPQGPGFVELGDGSANIIGGEVAKADDAFAKTVVGLYNTSAGSLCTASIISDSVLVTAAHCVEGEATDLIAVFKLDLRGSDLVVRRVQKATVSDEWATNQDNDTDAGDIALVKFAGGLPDGYKPAKLLADVADLKDGGDVLLAGYGISDGVAHTGAQILRSVTTQIKNATYSKTEVLMDQTKGKGACHGDSGGPAYVTVNGELRLFGVTSRGVDDPNNDCTRYAAYTNILSYGSWMKKTIDSFNESPRGDGTPVATQPPSDAGSTPHGRKRRHPGAAPAAAA